jgi:hypothetical protein
MTRSRYPQFSTGAMLLMMAVFCGMAAGLFYASGVPAIREEIGLLTGSPITPATRQSRAPWVAFILFTYIAPLLLAGLLSLVSFLWRWNRERIALNQSPPDGLRDRHPLD